MNETVEQWATRVAAYRSAARKEPSDLTAEDWEVLRSPPFLPADWPTHWPPREALRDERMTIEKIVAAAEARVRRNADEGDAMEQWAPMTATPEDRFFLSRDHSGHWYIVPWERTAEWGRWLDLPDDHADSWEAPEWATRVNGSPSLVTFSDPEVGR